MRQVELINTLTNAISKFVKTTGKEDFTEKFSFRMQNRLRITEMKHEMANLHASKLHTQLKSFIKISRWEKFNRFWSSVSYNLFTAFSFIKIHFPFDFFMICARFVSTRDDCRRKLSFNLNFNQSNSICRPYYETRANANARLRSLKSRIIEMEAEVQKAKASYNEALQNLEKISDEIHKLREDQKLSDFHEEVREFPFDTLTFHE